MGHSTRTLGLWVRTKRGITCRGARERTGEGEGEKAHGTGGVAKGRTHA